jgi:predicted phage terminase large subunit-like protein
MTTPRFNLHSLKELPEDLRAAILSQLTKEELAQLATDWGFIGRPEQTFWLTDEDYVSILYLTGRGWGKTRTGSEWIYHMAKMAYGHYGTVIAPTGTDLREVVIEGPSGILAVCDSKRDFHPNYNKASGLISFPNGVKIRSISAETPDRIRGSNSTFAWVDEIAAAPQAKEALEMLLFANRIPGKGGRPPKMFFTTTPKPTHVIIGLVKECTKDPKRHRLVSGSIFENADNLSQSALHKVEELKGTRLYRQEALGEVIDLSEQGIVKRSQFKIWPRKVKIPKLRYIVASYDTAFTQRQLDKKTMTVDPSACTIWGLVRGPSEDGEYGKGPYVALLYDCWEEYLGFPELKKKLKEDAKTKWGEEGRPTDLLLIEDKGSGRSIRQELEMEGIFAFSFSPGKDDKITRLHGVTPLFAAGRVYVPESHKAAGEPMTWVEPLIEQMTTFPHAAHDDMVDTVSQVLTWFRDAGALSAMPPKESDTVLVDRDDPKIVSTQVQVSSSTVSSREPEDDDRHSRIVFGGKAIRIRGRGLKNPYAQ